MAWILSIVIRFALSRQREYLADAGSVELTKNPDAMISALRKIEGRGELAGATSAVMEMCIDNPREGFSNMFDTHPPVEKRVEALVKFAGGHDPGPLAHRARRRRRQEQLAAPEEEDAPAAGCAADRALVARAGRAAADAARALGPAPGPLNRPVSAPRMRSACAPARRACAASRRRRARAGR